MAIYTFEARNGDVIERNFPIGEFPPFIRVKGVRYRKVLSRSQTSIPAQHRASTYAGRDGDKLVARHYRQNKEVGEGLANGTMMPPQDRGITGEGQTRESIAQLNQFYDAAKRK